MTVQQFIIPALVALFTSSAIVAAFYVRGYSALKKQLQDLIASNAKMQDQAVHSAKVAPEKIAELARQVETCRSRVDELERRRNFSFEAAAAAAAPAPQSPSFAAAPANGNRRSQIMRLHRSGESIASIASALGVSQGEVKLIVKVQEMLAENGNADRSSDFL